VRQCVPVYVCVCVCARARRRIAYGKDREYKKNCVYTRRRSSVQAEKRRQGWGIKLQRAVWAPKLRSAVRMLWSARTRGTSLWTARTRTRLTLEVQFQLNRCSWYIYLYIYIYMRIYYVYMRIYTYMRIYVYVCTYMCICVWYIVSHDADKCQLNRCTCRYHLCVYDCVCKCM
jgi:hypothetical protein